MTVDFAEASSCTRLAEDRWRADVDESWLQGRAIFGGMQSALALRCFQTLVPATRMVRTLNVHFCGPCAAGTVDVEARVARAGRRVSCVVGRVSQGGEAVAEVTATFAEDREHWLDLAVFSRNQVLLFGKDVDFETHVVLRHTGSAVAPALPVDYLVILDNVLLSS